MKRFTEEEITALKQTTDLVALVRASGVDLKPSGDNFIGLCPFHNDTEPSLVVSPKKHLWNCLGACGEGGSAIDWMMKTKQIDFKDAVTQLKTGNTVQPSNPTRTNTITLDQISDHYHKRLFENKKALNYLKQRGLTKPELYSRFKIGFADGTLSEMIDDQQREALKAVGVFRKNNREHFYGYLTVPLFDEHDRITGIYGRAVNPKSAIRHLYLKGDHQGIFNPKSSKVYSHMILTESILDALSLLEMGIENVQPIYGVNGLTADHITTLNDHRVKSITLSLNNDEAGHKATATLKQTLTEEGFNVSVIMPEKKDWNDVLTNPDQPVEEISKQTRELFRFTLVPTEKSEPDSSKPTDSRFQSVKTDPLGTLFDTGDLVYKLTGIKELFVSSLRVGIKATEKAEDETEKGESWYDSLDLYSAKSRSTYSRNLGRIFDLESKRVEKDLITILEYLEDKRDQELLNQGNKKTRKKLSPEEVNLGMSFLKDPDLFTVISQDLDTLGYTGEDLNKQLLYLAASSRKMDDPISVIIQSQSASGKSKMVDTIIELMPEEAVVSVTSLSDQALNYSTDLMHKFLSLGEAVHSEAVEHQIREMLSAKRLSRLVTLKDPKTGKMVSKQVVTPAVVSAVITATGFKINPENASRSFLLNIDESKEQTRKIHNRQRTKYSPGRFYEKQDKIPEIIRKHRAAQTLLKKRVIFNRFAELLDFPDSLVRTRRDNDRFIDLISVVCFLRQYQKRVQNDGRTDYIECDLNDYQVAYEIMVNGVLHSSLEEIPRGSRELYASLRELAGIKAKHKGVSSHEVSFTQREIREQTGYGQSWLKLHLRRLVDYEYVSICRGGIARSKGFYRLVTDDPMESLDLSVIPSPQAMKRLMTEGLQTGQGKNKSVISADKVKLVKTGVGLKN